MVEVLARQDSYNSVLDLADGQVQLRPDGSDPTMARRKLI